MNAYDRQQQVKKQQYELRVQEEAQNQRVKKQAKSINQTKRQRIQESASNYGTLTNALLNGSLVKWIFVLLMLIGTIATFNSIAEDHWIDIIDVNGQQKYVFNEDVYENDFTSYALIGERVITNFEGMRAILQIGTDTFTTVSDGIEQVYNFLYKDTGIARVVSDISDFVYRFYQWRNNKVR
jgi:hypothetical protein